MATTCRDIVTRALRMTGVVPREDDPSAAELSDGMTVLQSLLSGWITGGMFGRLADVFAEGDADAEEGQRITVDSAIITIPTVIYDTATGMSRAPREDSAIVVVTSDGEAQYLFSGGQWHRIDSSDATSTLPILTADSTAPLASRGVNGLAACVALAFIDEFGGQIGPGALMQARNFKTSLSYKFGSERPAYAGTWF